jgi:hypothetical protein
MNKKVLWVFPLCINIKYFTSYVHARKFTVDCICISVDKCFFHFTHSWCDNFNRKAWEPGPITVSLPFFSNLFAPSLLNIETSTLMWSSISYELTFQRNMPRLMFRADNKVVLSEMKFIRRKHSCYSLQKFSVHRTERKPSCAQMKR